MAKKKIAAEILADAEAAQKAIAPHLYPEVPVADLKVDDVTADAAIIEPDVTGVSAEEAPAVIENPPDIDYKAENERLQAELAKIAEEVKRRDHSEKTAHGRLKALSDDYQDMKARMAELESKKSAPIEEKPKSASLSYEELVDEGGEALAKEIISLREIAQQHAKMLETTSQTSKAIGQSVADVAQATFINNFIAKVPNYIEMQKDDKFLEFLDGKWFDTIPTTRRQELEAFNNALDADSCAKIYKAYEASITAPTNVPTVPPVIAPKKSLAAMTTPGHAKKGESTVISEKRITSDDFPKMYAEIAKLKSAGKHEAAQKIQGSIDRYVEASFKQAS